MQTVYRTVHGMAKNHVAMQMQLRAEMNGAEDVVKPLMKRKCRTLWALQTLQQFRPAEVQDVATLMRQWAQQGVAIATIESKNNRCVHVRMKRSLQSIRACSPIPDRAACRARAGIFPTATRLVPTVSRWKLWMGSWCPFFRLSYLDLAS